MKTGLMEAFRQVRSFFLPLVYPKSTSGAPPKIAPEDFDLESEKGLRRAAEAGNPTAQYRLGIKYLHGEFGTLDQKLAAEWLHKAALGGDADAQFVYGAHCQHGKGVPKNPCEAVKWYRLAADQGHAAAQFNLGCCYEIGEGVEQNKDQAIHWYRRAAEQGDAESQVALDEVLGGKASLPATAEDLDSMTPEQLAAAHKRAEEMRALIEAKLKRAGK